MGHVLEKAILLAALARCTFFAKKTKGSTMPSGKPALDAGRRHYFGQIGHANS